jgi:hypothetical protein
MRKVFLILFVLTTLSSLGQSLKKLKVFCTDEFDVKASITVTAPNHDPIGMSDIIKNNLVMSGFKVISETAARQKTELTNNKSVTDTTLKQEISIGKTTYINTVYVITFTYEPYTNITGNYLLGLNGQVVDLAKDGEIVATFSYHHSSFGAKKPNVIVKALCQDLRKKAKNV